MSTPANPFVNMSESLDNACLKIFGNTATFYPATGGSYVVTGILMRPTMFEELMPGFGSVNIRLFCRFIDLNPVPVRGDVVSMGGNSYDVADIQVDETGGAEIRLRERS